jgi:hypothetical protein
MSVIVFEHVLVAELLPEWRTKLAKTPGATVTVRIEEEAQDGAKAYADNPLFGMWRDRENMADAAGYVRGIRTDRFSDNTPSKAQALCSEQTQDSRPDPTDSPSIASRSKHDDRAN